MPSMCATQIIVCFYISVVYLKQVRKIIKKYIYCYSVTISYFLNKYFLV